VTPLQLLKDAATFVCCLLVLALVDAPEPADGPEPDYLDLWARQQERKISGSRSQPAGR
jgi:hypothetical protein